LKQDGSRGRGRTHSEGGEPHDQGDEEYEGYGDEEEDLMGEHEYVNYIYLVSYG